jgi:hypothetical protein
LAAFQRANSRPTSFRSETGLTPVCAAVVGNCPAFDAGALTPSLALGGRARAARPGSACGAQPAWRAAAAFWRSLGFPNLVGARVAKANKRRLRLLEEWKRKELQRTPGASGRLKTPGG